MVMILIEEIINVKNTITKIEIRLNCAMNEAFINSGFLQYLNPMSYFFTNDIKNVIISYTMIIF